MNFTDFYMQLTLVAFLVIFAVVRRHSRVAMMMYVLAFNLYFAHRLNGMQMWLLPLTACLNYALVQEMSLREGKARRLLLWAVVAADIGALAYFKYTTFIFDDVIGALIDTNFSLHAVVMPVGVSFYTFQAVSYAVDVYRRRFTMEVTLLEYLFYLTFFPLLLAGPITRAASLLPQLRRNSPASGRMVWTGLWLLMLGMLKKFVVADYIAQFNNWVFESPQSFSGFENMAAFLGYPVQIYLDFSGYSDMSIGVAAMLGIMLPDNFRFPYRSLSLTEFWRRWHISLSTWFRDYLYIPLGGNRKGTLRMYLNNFVTMLVAGLWHGASWMFVIWGAMHGIGLAVHKFFSRQLGLRFPDSVVGNALSWLLTYAYVCVAWTFFRAADMGCAVTMLTRMVTDFGADWLVPFVCARPVWTLLVVASMLSWLVTERQYTRMQMRFICLPWAVKFVSFLVLAQLAVQMSSENVQPFIYAAF